MIDNVFDRVVKNILLKFRIGYDPRSWDRLEAKLDRAKEDDILFDTLISNKLKSYSLPYSSGAFEKFENEYLDKKSPDKRIYYYISGIAAAILLIAYSVLLIKYHNVLNPNLDVKNTVATNSNIEESKRETTGPKDIVAIDKGFSDYKSNQPNSSRNNSPIRHILHNTNIFALNKTDFGLDYRFGNINNHGYTVMDFYNPASFNSYTRSGLYQNGIQGIDYFPFQITLRLNFQSNNKDIKFNDYNKKENAEEIKEEFSVENDEAVALDEISKDIVQPVIDSITDIASIPSGFSINGFIAPSASIINTPNDKDFYIPGYTQISPGYTAGLTFSFTKNKYELESGLEFASIGYSPHKNIVKKDSSSIYLANIYYSLLSLPFNLKYHFYKSKNWDLYAFGGISASMVTNSKYQFVEIVESGDHIHTLTKLAEELKEDIGFNQTLYGNKKYNKGVTDGGKMKNNIYFAGSTGFGLKRKLSNGLSLYFEPQFKYNFNDFGPNNDNIIDFCFKFGLSKTISM